MATARVVGCADVAVDGGDGGGREKVAKRGTSRRVSVRTESEVVMHCDGAHSQRSAIFCAHHEPFIAWRRA